MIQSTFVSEQVFITRRYRHGSRRLYMVRIAKASSNNKKQTSKNDGTQNHANAQINTHSVFPI